MHSIVLEIILTKEPFLFKFANKTQRIIYKKMCTSVMAWKTKVTTLILIISAILKYAFKLEKLPLIQHKLKYCIHNIPELFSILSQMIISKIISS